MWVHINIASQQPCNQVWIITCNQVWTILESLQKPLVYKPLLVSWAFLGQYFVARKDAVEAEAGSSVCCSS